MSDYNEVVDHRTRMYIIFDHLFATESPHGGENAFNAQVYFRSGYRVEGTVTSCSLDGERGPRSLKLAAIALQPDPTDPGNRAKMRKVIAEHYFDYEDVEAVIIMRDVDPTKIVGDAGKSRIIPAG